MKRFISHGALNSPWGIVEVKAGFLDQDEHAIIVGNFGDGHINGFTDDGKFLGPLKDKCRPTIIEGLWGLENNVPMANPRKLFFTAGPIKETHGLFGYLLRRL